MKFFNRYILLFTVMVSIWTALFYMVLIYLLKIEQYIAVGVSAFVYGLGIYLAGRLTGRKDPYKGHVGFNYHFMTYVVCVSAAWIAQEGFGHESAALSMTLTWGIGIIIHFIVWLNMRKKRLSGFDKDELFE